MTGNWGIYCYSDTGSLLDFLSLTSITEKSSDLIDYVIFS